MEGAERGFGFRSTKRDAQKKLELQHMVDPDISTVEETTTEIHAAIPAR